MKKLQQLSRSQKIAQRINKKIESWQKERGRLVIGIEGYSASGKTTVADCLALENPGIVIIHLDDLLKSSAERAAMMNSGDDRSKVFELKWYRYDLLDRIVKKFKKSLPFSVKIYDYDLKKTVTRTYDLSKKILVIEGIFLFHPEHAISEVFDKKIYLDVNFQQADSRRVRREKKRWGKQYVDENHPDSYVIPFKEAYRRYFKTHHPERLADLTIKII